MRSRRRIVALLLLGALLGPAAPALASGCPKTSLSGAEQQLMCVSCGVPLEIADSPQADGERRLIVQLVAQCDTLAQVKQEMVAQYGTSVLALPPARGTNLAIYIVPIVAAIAALGGVGWLARRWRRDARDATAAPGEGDELTEAASVSTVDAHRLDEELARFDG